MAGEYGIAQRDHQGVNLILAAAAYEGDLDPPQPRDATKHACTWPGCGREFKKRKYIEAHVNEHHLNIKYACEGCGALYSRQSEMNYRHRCPKQANTSKDDGEGEKEVQMPQTEHTSRGGTHATVAEKDVPEAKTPKQTRTSDESEQEASSNA